jgi:hypothetical protein
LCEIEESVCLHQVRLRGPLPSPRSVDLPPRWCPPESEAGGGGLGRSMSSTYVASLEG